MKPVPNDIANAIGRGIARRIEFGAEVYRQWGFAFPRDYDVGIVVHQDGWIYRLELRIDSVSVTFDLDVPRAPTDAQAKMFRSGLTAAAMAAVSAYADRHFDRVEREVVARAMNHGQDETTLAAAAKAARDAILRREP